MPFRQIDAVELKTRQVRIALPDDLDLDPFGRVVPLLPAGDLPENPGKEVRRGLFPGYCGCQSIGVSVSAEGAEGV